MTAAPADLNKKDQVSSVKPQLHLVPFTANIVESEVMALGAAKYGAYNWRETPIKTTRYISAALRHLAQYLDGEDDDEESGMRHLAHARATLGILLDAEACGMLIDDRPKKGDSARLLREFTEKAQTRLLKQ